MIEKLYTVEEVAELASVTGRTIRNYQKSGRLVGRKIGGQWRFTEAEVQRLLTGAPPEDATIEQQAPVHEAPQWQEPMLQVAPAQPAAPVVQPAASVQPAAPVQPAEPAPPASQSNEYDELPENDFDDVKVYMPSTSYDAPAASPFAPPSALPNPPVGASPVANQPSAPSQENPFSPVQPSPQGQQPVPQGQPAFNAYPQQAGYAPATGQPAATPAYTPPVYPLPTVPTVPGVQQPMPQQPVQEAQQPAWPQPYAPSIVHTPPPVSGGFSAAPNTQPAYPAPVQVPQAYPPSPSGQRQHLNQDEASAEAATAPVPPAPAAQDAFAAATTGHPAPDENTAALPTPPEAPQAATEEIPALPELSDVGKRVAEFVSEVHNCEFGPQTCSVIDLYQSLEAAEYTSQQLSEIADDESGDGFLCQSFAEYDERYEMARYTLFGSSSFLLRCLKLIG